MSDPSADTVLHSTSVAGSEAGHGFSTSSNSSAMVMDRAAASFSMFSRLTLRLPSSIRHVESGPDA